MRLLLPSFFLSSVVAFFFFFSIFALLSVEVMVDVSFVLLLRPLRGTAGCSMALSMFVLCFLLLVLPPEAALLLLLPRLPPPDPRVVLLVGPSLLYSSSSSLLLVFCNASFNPSSGGSSLSS